MRPIASLSLDLDNKWSYMKTHGDPGWENYPSYLDVVVPRFLEIVDRLGLKMTVFVVGQDAALEKNRAPLAQISASGHEIGNHSFRHEPWLHLYSATDLEAEIALAEDALEEATGVRPDCFRGPGYSLSPALLELLSRRGYRFDASTFPTFIGPLARAYYFFTARLSAAQRQERKRLFGTWREGFRPVRAYWWQIADEDGEDRRLLEIPVTTMPVFCVPFHVSYLLYLRQFSRAAAWAHFRLALALCRLTGVGPSLLLHPLDFLGGDD
jgi:peptidoglycan/xylan/chitin deacetylase (PgdA/CDA1 family)